MSDKGYLQRSADGSIDIDSTVNSLGFIELRNRIDALREFNGEAVQGGGGVVCTSAPKSSFPQFSDSLSLLARFYS